MVGRKIILTMGDISRLQLSAIPSELLRRTVP
jgi:hypothetical protein